MLEISGETEVNDVRKKCKNEIPRKMTSELYQNFSNQKFLREKLNSEYNYMKKLEDAVKLFDYFRDYRDLPLKECAKKLGIDDVESIFDVCFYQSILRYFAEAKEEYFDNIDNDKINFFEMGEINIHKPRYKMDIKPIIKEIRDAIGHSTYIIGENGLLIYNPTGPKHPQEFEAEVSWRFLSNIVHMGKNAQAFNMFYFYDGNVDYDRTFAQNAGNISIKQLFIPKSSQITYDDIYQMSDEELDMELQVGRIKEEELKFSNDEVNELSNLFDEYEFNPDSLRLATGSLERFPKPRFHNRMVPFFNGMNNFNMTFDDCCENEELTYFLTNSKKNVFSDVNYPDEVTYEEIEQTKDLIIDTNYCMEALPVYLRILYIANSYLNTPTKNLILTPDDLCVSDDEAKGINRHIRNAIAHGHYSLLPNSNNVLFWDKPLSKKQSGRYGAFSLHLLYEHCKENTDRYGKYKNIISS